MMQDHIRMAIAQMPTDIEPHVSMPTTALYAPLHRDDTGQLVLDWDEIAPHNANVMKPHAQNPVGNIGCCIAISS